MEINSRRYPPRTLFDDIQACGQYVCVLVPPPKKKSDGGIELPDSVVQDGERQVNEFPVLVHSVGPDVEDSYGPGNEVFVSLFMQQPHQTVIREMDNGEEARLFFIDSGMIVGLKTS